MKLTEQQSRLLRAIRMKKQALVCGGAGTGKTLLALERARDIASSGRLTLLVCYNNPLAEHLSKVAANTQTCTSQLTIPCVSRGPTRFVRRPAGTWSKKLKFSIRIKHTSNVTCRSLAASLKYTGGLTYVVDEAQDFWEDFWFGLLWLLKDPKESILNIFYDHNQALYASTEKLPIPETPFLLTRNCRNTKPIHELTYQYYRGEPTDAPELAGDSIREIHGVSCRPQAARLHAEIVRLISEEGIRAEQIIILVATSSKTAYYKELVSHPLPTGTRWAIEVHGQPNAVLLETSPRFKGLESPIVFLWGIDQVDPFVDRELLYVSLSRAKSKLYLVSAPAACALIRSHVEHLNANVTTCSHT